MNRRNIMIGPKSRDKQERAKALRSGMTEAEARLWAALRGNQCKGLHFRRQQVIDGFIADFYCHAAGLIIEVDGGIHEQQIDYDRLREQILAAWGLTILRFSNDRIMTDLSNVLVEIVAAT